MLKQQLVAPNLEDLSKNIDNIIISLFLSGFEEIRAYHQRGLRDKIFLSHKE